MRNSFSKYFDPTESQSQTTDKRAKSLSSHGRPSPEREPRIAEESKRHASRQSVQGILKKSSKLIVRPNQRPASVGHSSVASLESGNSSLQKKRLSWGKSKVLEYYPEERKANESYETGKKTDIRDRGAKRESHEHAANSQPRQRIGLLSIAKEYEAALNNPASLPSSRHASEEKKTPELGEPDLQPAESLPPAMEEQENRGAPENAEKASQLGAAGSFAPPGKKLNFSDQVQSEIQSLSHVPDAAQNEEMAARTEDAMEERERRRSQENEATPRKSDSFLQ